MEQNTITSLQKQNNPQLAKEEREKGSWKEDLANIVYVDTG